MVAHGGFEGATDTTLSKVVGTASASKHAMQRCIFKPNASSSAPADAEPVMHHRGAARALLLLSACVLQAVPCVHHLKAHLCAHRCVQTPQWHMTLSFRISFRRSSCHEHVAKCLDETRAVEAGKRQEGKSTHRCGVHRHGQVQPGSPAQDGVVLTVGGAACEKNLAYPAFPRGTSLQLMASHALRGTKSSPALHAGAGGQVDAAQGGPRRSPCSAPQLSQVHTGAWEVAQLQAQKTGRERHRISVGSNEGEPHSPSLATFPPSWEPRLFRNRDIGHHTRKGSLSAHLDRARAARLACVMHPHLDGPHAVHGCQAREHLPVRVPAGCSCTVVGQGPCREVLYVRERAERTPRSLIAHSDHPSGAVATC